MLPILLFIFLVYISLVLIEYTCLPFTHKYRVSGTTSHVAYNKKTLSFVVWKRQWKTCNTCGKVIKGDKINN